MNIVFLDFDGVLDTTSYDMYGIEEMKLHAGWMNVMLIAIMGLLMTSILKNSIKISLKDWLLSIHIMDLTKMRS